MGRSWRLPHLGRNPLVRSWDRVESAVLVLAVSFAVAAIPVAAALGSETYAHQKQVAATENATRHRTTAVLTADAPMTTMSPHGLPVRGTTRVAATWHASEGTTRTGTVSAERGTSAGTTVAIWVDENDDPVPAPVDAGSATVVAITTAAMAWLAAAALLTGMFLAFRLLLDRARYTRWEREWVHLDTNTRRTP